MAITQINRAELDILRDARENLVQNVGISADNSTSTSLNLLKSMSKEVSSMWDYMNALLRRNFITTAYGDSLDEIGVLLQEPRIGFKRAMDLSTTNIKFYLDEAYALDVTDLINRYLTLADRKVLKSQNVIDDADNPTTINLPASIIITNTNGNISYTTMNPMSISNTQPWDFTPVISAGVGENYNVSPGTLTKHNITYLYPIFAKINQGIKVRNIYGIRNGGDIESDENYKYRLSNKVVSAVAGNETAVRKAVLSVPGVVDLSITPRSHGNGTCTIFPRTVEPILSDGIMQAVISSTDTIKSFGSVVYVEAPEYLAAAFNVELRFIVNADMDAIFMNARLTIMDYINNLDLGGEIIINEIIQRVMSISDQILDMNITQFGFGQYNRQTGAVTSYIPLRLLNQRADWNQKWYTNSNFCAICQAGTR